MKSRLVTLLLLCLLSLYAPNPFAKDTGDVGLQMVTAFVGDRDYAKALKFARMVPRDSEYSDIATVLKRELPKRKDDFKKLKLPTPAEWNALQARLSKEDKVRYLCERLRLLNYFNDDKWGETVTQPQFREPLGMTYRSMSHLETGRELGAGKTETINPLLILAAAVDKDRPWIPRDINPTFQLTLDDIPLLTEYMSQDWATVGLDFGRLDRTSDLLGSIVYALSDEMFFDLITFSRLSDASKRGTLGKLQEWARASHGVAKSERLARRVKEVHRWSEIRNLDGNIAASKRADLVPYLFGMIDSLNAQRNQPDQYPRLRVSDIYTVLSVCESLDVQTTATKTREFLHDRDPSLRLLAGRHEFLYRDKHDGALVMCSAIKDGKNHYLTGANALEMLLQSKEPCAIETIRAVLQNHSFSSGSRQDQADFLARLRKSGSSEGYRWLLTSLADSTDTGSWLGENPIRGRNVAAELTAKYMAPPSAGLTYSFESTPDQKAKDRRKQAQWLKAQIRQREAAQR